MTASLSELSTNAVHSRQQKNTVQHLPAMSPLN